MTPSSPKYTSTKSEFRKKEIWRIIFFFFISSISASILFENGLQDINKSRIYIKGNKYMEREKIIPKVGIIFPSKLLYINPKKIEESLIKSLPIKAVKINRRILPPGLFINILEREPIGFASRLGPNGQENGFLDQEAYWISSEDYLESKINKNNIALRIEGWMISHQKRIALIYKNRDKFKSPIKKILLRPNGEISIQTENFHFIHLGSNPALLREQISTLANLSKALPREYVQKTNTTIDLKNPLNPKLRFE